MGDPGLQRALRDPDRLQALRESGLLEATPEESFDRITRLSKRLLEVPVALINLLDAERQVYKSCLGLPEKLEVEREIDLSHSYCKHTVVTGEALVAPDARKHPLLRDNPAIEDLDAIAYLGVPLVTDDDHVLGTHCVIDHQPRAWTEEDIETLTVHARAAATEIDLRRERARLAALQEELEQRVRDRTAELRKAKEKYEAVVETSPVAMKVLRPEADEYLQVNESFEEVFDYGRSVLLDGSVGSDMLWEDPEKRGRLYRRLEHKGVLRNQEARFRRRDGTVFDGLFSASTVELDEERLLVAAIQDISYLKEIERELEHHSLYDELTGLPNRTLFWDRLQHALERARRTGGRIAVFFIDLDGFSRINAEHGHAAGDDVLRRVADRLQSAVREADTLARLGADEFGVLLEDLSEDSEAVEAARGLTDRFEETVSVAGEEALVALSCGVACEGGASERNGTVTPDELVHRADRAMSVAKEKPGSSFHRYSPDAAAEPPGRLRREVELKEALEAGSVVPYYQPIVDLEDGRVVGAEALARWEHPERGLEAPGAFIPLAEETGLIVRVGQEVVRAACLQLSAWRKGGRLPPDFRLHLNLSARELDLPELFENLGEIFREAELEPERVAFEVTETAAIQRSHVVRQIRERGSPVAVDDFGTGYATLERLAEIDFDSLKIDRSFVAGVGASARHEAVLQASLTLADSLDLCPVAEGVETERQRRYLLSAGCRYGQGFLFAKALPGVELMSLLEESRTLPME